MIYRCRFTKPTTEAWFNVEAYSPEDAAVIHHDQNPLVGYLSDEEETLRFALIEIEGYRTILTRKIFSKQ